LIWFRVCETMIFRWVDSNSNMFVVPRWFVSLGRWFPPLFGSFPMARTFDNHIQALALKSKWSLTEKSVIFIFLSLFHACSQKDHALPNLYEFVELPAETLCNGIGAYIMHNIHTYYSIHQYCNTPDWTNWNKHSVKQKPKTTCLTLHAVFTMPQPLSLWLLPVFFWPWASCAGPCGKVHWKDGYFKTDDWIFSRKILTQLHIDRVTGLPSHFP